MDTNINKLTSEDQIENENIQNDQNKQDAVNLNVTEGTDGLKSGETDFLADILSKATSIPEIKVEPVDEVSVEEVVAEQEEVPADEVYAETVAENPSNPDEEISTEEIADEEDISAVDFADDVLEVVKEEYLETNAETNLISEDLSAYQLSTAEEVIEEAEQSASDIQTVIPENTSKNRVKKSPKGKKKKVVKPRSLLMEYVHHWYIIVISIMMCLPAYLTEIFLGNLFIAKEITPFFAALLTMFIGGLIATLPFLVLNIILVVRKKYYAIAVQLITMQLLGMIFYIYSKIILGIG